MTLSRSSIIPNRARDDALNSAAHACSQSWQIWNQYALRNSTLDIYDLWNGRHLFLTGLERSEDAGSRIKTIRFEVRRSRTQQQIRLIDFAQLSNLPISVRKEAREKDGRFKAVQMFYEKLVNLEELIILHPSFMLLSFVQKVDGKSVPLPFLSHSLKRLYISKFERGTIRAPLTAKNVAWLLLFCQNLFEAAFGGLEFSVQDCRFLLDHSQAYEGLSKIKRLALSIEFVFDQSKMSTWWGLGLTSSGRDLSKNNAVIHLLRMTDQLTSLEVFFNDAARNPRDETYLSSNFTSSLHSSFSSLKHLRLGGIQCDPDNPSSTDYSKFTALTIMTLDHLVFQNLLNSSVKLPTTLTTFILPFYCFFPEDRSFDHFKEDTNLAVILRTRDLPDFLQIVLPSKPLVGGFEYAPASFKADWDRKRSALKKEAMITSGKVSLREIEPGELSEYFDI